MVTGTRSEFGILEPVCRAIRSHSELDLRLVVTGVHLLRRFGCTVEEVERSGLEIACRVPFYDEHSGIELPGLPGAMGRGLAGLGGAIREHRADVVVVLGDRAEAMVGALAGYSAGRCVAHLHGGEKTDSGALDEGFRHAITRLAHLHFAATEAAARRLIAMGEEPSRVHLCGAPGLDNAYDFVQRWNAAGAEVGERDFRRRHRLHPERPLALFLLHPDRWHREGLRHLTVTILERMLARGLDVLAIRPNGDPGSEEITAALGALASEVGSRLMVYASLPRAEFHAALSCARMLVGNSSAGPIEAPVFGIPVINVGERNRDREHGPGVEFVGTDPAEVDAAIGRALTVHRAPGPHPGPYGDGAASQRIAAVLARVEVDPTTLGKRLRL